MKHPDLLNSGCALVIGNYLIIKSQKNQPDHGKFQKWVLIFFISFGFASKAYSLECESSNEALRAMKWATLTIKFWPENERKSETQGKELSLLVRVADNDITRSAGFQNVCPSTIRETPILFIFDRPLIPAFHMNNVFASLDIAFIDELGAIESIQKMLPYTMIRKDKPLYRPGARVKSALETHVDFFSQNGVTPKSQIQWVLEEEPATEDTAG